MPYVLPVPAPPPDRPDATAQVWETAAPGYDGPNRMRSGGSVTMNRTGPGDMPTAQSVDQWMGEDIYIVPRDGVMNGEQLFIGIPNPPNEGHGEYTFAQDGPWIDHSTRNQALFWSDWQASTPAHAFRGEHIVIARVPPGSVQGYQPSEMVQPNNERSMPGPWDAQLAVGRDQYLMRQAAQGAGAVSGV